MDLIATDGVAAVTHQRAAEKAGVGRATVYRHWPHLSDLLNDALAGTTLRFLDPAPGALLDRAGGDTPDQRDATKQALLSQFPDIEDRPGARWTTARTHSSS